MPTPKAVTQLLLLVVALLALGHLAYSGSPATKKKAHPTRVSNRKKTRKNHRARHQTPSTARGRALVYTVMATTYQAVPAQTDSRPFVTADNSTIRRGYSSRQRWLAVSRDLLKQGGGRIHYGDKVHVRGVSPKLDGIYTVHDTMHKRHRHRIDILSNPHEKLALSASKVKLQLLGVTTAKPPRRRPELASAHARHLHARPVVSRPARGHRRRTPGGLLT